MLGIIRYVGISGNSVEDNALRSKHYVETHRQLESFWVINGPRKLGHVKVDKLIQVKYWDQVELRGVNLCRKVLQILANTVKEKGYESQKDGTCCGRQTDLVRAGVWRLKSNVKMSEPWSTWPDQQPLPQARCIRFEGYCKVWVQWDYWQIEEGLAMLEKEWHLSWAPVSMAQIVPRIDWERPVHSYLLTEGWSVSVQEMAPVSPRLSCSTVRLLPNEARSHIHNWCAQVQR